jgi:hypothetical protein
MLLFPTIPQKNTLKAMYFSHHFTPKANHVSGNYLIGKIHMF